MSAPVKTTDSVTENAVSINNETTAPDSCSQKQFLAHFRLYPLVNSTKEIIFMIPLARQCATGIAPTFHAIRNTNPIKAVMDRGDVIADETLNRIDTIAPGLKTYDYGDLHAPFTRPVNSALESSHRALMNTNESIKSVLIEPSARTVHDLRDRFHYVVYDNDGKGLIASSVDPLVGPLNEHLESFLLKRFPERKTESTTDSNELSRTVRIITSIILRNSTSSDVYPDVPDEKLENGEVGINDGIN